LWSSILRIEDTQLFPRLRPFGPRDVVKKFNYVFIICFYEIILNFVTITTTFFIFSLYCILIPLILGFWQELLQSFHLGILWTCLLFSFLPERFYIQDYQDGTLELYYLSRFTPFNFILFSKSFGYWILKISGILFSYPILSFFYQFDLCWYTCLTLIIGSFIFLLICSFHSCLTIDLKVHGQYGLHYLTTLPTLLPLILLCNHIQINSAYFYYLIGLAGLYFFMLIAFGSHILKNAINY
jgi:heme exporter protein CcmB